jgi:hypothetical protein
MQAMLLHRKNTQFSKGRLIKKFRMDQTTYVTIHSRQYHYKKVLICCTLLFDGGKTIVGQEAWKMRVSLLLNTGPLSDETIGVLWGICNLNAPLLVKGFQILNGSSVTWLGPVIYLFTWSTSLAERCTLRRKAARSSFKGVFPRAIAKSVKVSRVCSDLLPAEVRSIINDYSVETLRRNKSIGANTV